MKKPLRAVVFDLDGTLVYFRLDYKSARVEVIQTFAKLGFPPSLFSVKESTFKAVEKVSFLIRINGGTEEEVNRVQGLVSSIAERYEMEAARRTRLIPGVKAVLEMLKRMELKLAICTSNGRRATDYIVKNFQLSNLFDIIVTREMTPSTKPSPIHLQTTCSGLCLDPREALFVGDSVMDIEPAKRLGSVAVGVTTGRATSEDLRHAGADFIIPSLVELPALIRQIREG